MYFVHKFVQDNEYEQECVGLCMRVRVCAEKASGKLPPMCCAD